MDENVSTTQCNLRQRITGIPCLIHVIHPPLSVGVQLAADCICPGAQNFMRALMHSNFNAPQCPWVQLRWLSFDVGDLHPFRLGE